MKAVLARNRQRNQQLHHLVVEAASYGDVRGSLFWVTTRDGAVTGIAEQFLP